jgi:hypothetical protein
MGKTNPVIIHRADCGYYIFTRFVVNTTSNFPLSKKPSNVSGVLLESADIQCLPANGVLRVTILWSLKKSSSTYSANPQRSSFSAVTGPVETHAFSTWN